MLLLLILTLRSILGRACAALRDAEVVLDTQELAFLIAPCNSPTDALLAGELILGRGAREVVGVVIGIGVAHIGRLLLLHRVSQRLVIFIVQDLYHRACLVKDPEQLLRPLGLLLYGSYLLPTGTRYRVPRFLFLPHLLLLLEHLAPAPSELHHLVGIVPVIPPLLTPPRVTLHLLVLPLGRSFLDALLLLLNFPLRPPHGKLVPHPREPMLIIRAQGVAEGAYVRLMQQARLLFDALVQIDTHSVRCTAQEPHLLVVLLARLLLLQRPVGISVLLLCRPLQNFLLLPFKLWLFLLSLHILLLLLRPTSLSSPID